MHTLLLKDHSTSFSGRITFNPDRLCISGLVVVSLKAENAKEIIVKNVVLIRIKDYRFDALYK